MSWTNEKNIHGKGRQNIAVGYRQSRRAEALDSLSFPCPANFYYPTGSQASMGLSTLHPRFPIKNLHAIASSKMLQDQKKSVWSTERIEKFQRDAGAALRKVAEDRFHVDLSVDKALRTSKKCNRRHPPEEQREQDPGRPVEDKMETICDEAPVKKISRSEVTTVQGTRNKRSHRKEDMKMKPKNLQHKSGHQQTRGGNPSVKKKRRAPTPPPMPEAYLRQMRGLATLTTQCVPPNLYDPRYRHVSNIDPRQAGGMYNGAFATTPGALPFVFLSHGFKVTMLDWSLMIFVIDMVPRTTCETIKKLTSDHMWHMAMTGKSSKTWRTLYTYTKMDLPCCEVQYLTGITDMILSNLKLVVGDVFKNPEAASKLKPRSWKEPHLLLYQRVPGRKEHTGVEMHYDGCHMTFQVMLSDLDEYAGGGTYFRSLRRTIKLRKGQVLVHPGELYHLGVDIEFGFRCLVVGFLDGFKPGIEDPSSSKHDKEEYQQNTVIV